MSSFETHTVDQPAQAVELSKWLSEMGSKDTPLALAIRDRNKKLALSSLDDAWVLDFKSPAGPLIASILRSQLLEQTRLRLMTRNMAIDMKDFCKMMAPLWGVSALEVFRSLVGNFVGDLTAAAVCINQSVTAPGKFRLLEHAAYEIALLLPQYEYGIAPYYMKIGIPMAKLAVETALSPKAKPQWWVTYHYVWLKVLAALTGDPTLIWAFAQELDPVEQVAKIFKCNYGDAELMLLWQTCGRDIACFTRRFPGLVKNLPENPREWGPVIDRGLPAMSNACANMMQLYGEEHEIVSIYKRKLRPGNPVGEAVAFRVFGTTEELMAILAVTLWQNRVSDDTLIQKFEGGPAEETIRVLGSGPKEGIHAWLQTVKELAPLAEPLGAELHLRPVVTLAPQ